MVSKNRLCPCESGRLYKRCCGLEGNSKKHIINLLANYNTVDILQTIAALTLVPTNHGKNLRLENIARDAIVSYNNNAKFVPIDDLHGYLNRNFPLDYMEDPPGNLFTEVIAFSGGDYLILPGITESPVFILNSLVSAIYHWPNVKLKNQFKTNTYLLVRALLLISESMLRKAGFTRYMYGAKQGEKISFPSKDMLMSLKKAVWFSSEEMDSLLLANEVSPEVLNLFLTDIHDPGFKNKHVAESPLITKPLIAVKDGYLVASPASLCYALIESIKKEAENWNCTDEMHCAFHGFVWNSLQMNLKRLNFKTIDIPGVPIPVHEFVKTVFATFDDDKLAIIRYVPMSQVGKSPSSNILAKEYENLFDKISLVKGFENFRYMDITIPSVFGNELTYPIIGNQYSKTLVVNSFCFELLASSKRCSAIGLWKFAIARDEQLPMVAKMANLTFLDEFNIYSEHFDSFYLSHEGFDMVKWQYGNSQSMVEKVRRRNDEHCVSIRISGKLGKTYVARRDKYSPIYFSMMDLSAHVLRVEVEGFGTAVWVGPVVINNPSKEIDHIYLELTDTISYWLWQLCDDVKQYVQAIDKDYVLFSFELSNVTAFENLDDNLVRDKRILQKLKVSSSEDTIHLTIPPELIAFFYGPENEGDRLLVGQLLRGINDLLGSKGLLLLTDDQINAIIEKNAPLGPKKKLIFLHSGSNLLLDSRNLHKPRYIMDYDVSLVSNSIGKLLGADCPRAGEVVNMDEKLMLTRNIVMKGLLPHLKTTIEKYDNEELIKRLIALNETLINWREHQKIITPTRIACFVSQEDHTEDMLQKLSQISRTSIAVRCLLEHLAAEPAKGNYTVSTAGIDELVAIMDAIINWGSIGDQLRFSFFDIRLSVLPSGRINTQKNLTREIFDPYHRSKTNEIVQDAINSFEQEFHIPDSEELGKEIPQYLDQAFVEEFHVSLSRIFAFIDILAAQGFRQNTAYAVVDRKSLLLEAEKHEMPFSEVEFNHILNFIGLENRGGVDNIPKGYEGFDISPWRFNRRLSLLRRPVIICNKSDSENPLFYWGPRQVLLSRGILALQCQHDRLKVNSEKGPVKKAMSKLTNDSGEGFVKSILEILRQPNIIIDSEVKISKKGKLKHNSDIGDIDVLLIDKEEKRIYSLECKNFAPSRNIKEMIEECEKLMGSRSEKGLIEKHTIRHEWIKQNLKQISEVYKCDLDGFEVKSAILTREQMLFPHLQQMGFNIPFITKYDLEKSGLNSLRKL